jgi:hypothetical protein
MARVSSHEDDAVDRPAPLQRIAPAAAVTTLALPLIPLGDTDAAICVDGVCHLPD